MTSYRVIKDYPDELIDRLSHLETQYYALDGEEAKRAFYLGVRELFNEETLDDIDRTKYLIFLNRTCFNGLYRANKNGFFNVPKGYQENPLICNEENIRAVSDALSSVEIVCADYTASGRFIDQNTLVYLDPPYRPLKGRDSFVSYTENEFDDSCQRALAGFVEGLRDKGAYIILSNSDPKNVDEEDTFFDDLYADYDIQRIYAKRKINSNSNHRGYITELLIKNY